VYPTTTKTADPKYLGELTMYVLPYANISAILGVAPKLKVDINEIFKHKKK
jgi:hypothetical protein